MPSSRQFPKPGQVLTHTFSRRGQSGTVSAKVVSVDEKTGKIELSVGSKTYSSLSAAAVAQTGHPTNGWQFWGLEKAKGKKSSSSD